jgi:hypothetical protein
MNTAELHELQREVQRLLGRCMLRLQQYEQLMKSMWVNHEVAGSASDLESSHAKRRDNESKATLGGIATKLFESHIVDEPNDAPLLDPTAGESNEISFGFRMQIQMQPDVYVRVRTAVTELVQLRNDLVHHFLERFDISQQDGCLQAVEYLSASSEQIEARFSELLAWAKATDDIKAQLAAYMVTDEFRDLVFNGAIPNTQSHQTREAEHDSKPSHPRSRGHRDQRQRRRQQ